jgi:hypothetical protein
MKKFSILFFVFHFSFFIFHSVSAQWGCSCLPEGITFTNQAQIDSFQINYPGCNVIEGSVIIHGYEFINFSGMNGLTEIQGNLEIRLCNLSNLQGLENLSQIGGNLIIQKQSEGAPIGFVNLSGLDNLEYIGGDMVISRTTLESMEGLGSLSIVGGDFTIGGSGSFFPPGNPFLTSLSGMSQLETIGGNFFIGSNQQLTNLSGLENLASVGGGLSCFYNSSLVNLSGLENLNYIGGHLGLVVNDSLINLAGLENVSFIESVSIIGNENLACISELDPYNCDSISSIAIIGNTALSICEAQWLCEYLASPSGSVDIYNNAEGCSNPAETANNCGITLSCLPYGNYHCFSQDDVDNFQINYPGCTELAGDFFRIHGNSSSSGSNIANLEGLSDIISVGGSFLIEYNPLLTSLSGLDNLSEVGGYLRIYDNEYLNSLASLTNLTYIGDYLMIGGNDALLNLSGLEGLSELNGALYISGNESLESISSLIGINSVGGSISICGNDSLTSLYGLNNIDSIEGDFDLSYNDLLADITDIGGFTRIFGEMNIYQNPSLTSLIGLQNVTSIGDRLIVQNNDILTSLYGLENIDANSIGDLFIKDNELLSTCHVQSICDYLVVPNGIIEIWGNAPGCDSEEEVEAACLVGEEELRVTGYGLRVEVFPNPTSEIVHLEFEIQNPSPVPIQVFNAMGGIVAEFTDGILTEGKHLITWNAADLPAGLYFCKIQLGQQVMTQKIVKL